MVVVLYFYWKDVASSPPALHPHPSKLSEGQHLISMNMGIIRTNILHEMRSSQDLPSKHETTLVQCWPGVEASIEATLDWCPEASIETTLDLCPVCWVCTILDKIWYISHCNKEWDISGWKDGHKSAFSSRRVISLTMEITQEEPDTWPIVRWGRHR